MKDHWERVREGWETGVERYKTGAVQLGGEYQGKKKSKKRKRQKRTKRGKQDILM